MPHTICVWVAPQTLQGGGSSNADAGRERNAVLIDVGSWWWYARGGDPPASTANRWTSTRFPTGTRPGRRRGPRDGLWRLPERLARVGGPRRVGRRSRPRGQVLGHEPAGEVVTVGDSVDRFAPGDRVVVPFSRSATAPVRAVGRDTGTSVTTGERSASSRGARRVRRARRRPGRRLQPRRAPAVARRDRRGRARLPVHDRVSRPRGAGWTRRRRVAGRPRLRRRRALGSPTGRRARGTDRRGRCRRRRPLARSRFGGRQDCESERPRRGDGSGPGSKPHRRTGRTFLWTRSVSPRRAATRSGPFAPAGTRAGGTDHGGGARVCRCRPTG